MSALSILAEYEMTRHGHGKVGLVWPGDRQLVAAHTSRTTTTLKSRLVFLPGVTV
jgi:hypothetical protein